MMLYSSSHQNIRKRVAALLICFSLVEFTSAFAPATSTTLRIRTCSFSLATTTTSGGDPSSFWLRDIKDALQTTARTTRLYHSSPLGLMVPQEENEEQKDDEPQKEDDTHDETYQIALRNTFWSVAVAVLFGAGVWLTAGPTVGQEFFAGYIVEKRLSVDNLFVFLLLFDNFQIPPQYQSRILSWGIYGSIILRAIMISLGATALHGFRGILLVFAGILIYSAVQVLVDVEEEIEHKSADLRANPVVWVARHLCGSNDTCDVDSFEEDAKSGQTNPVILFSQSLFPSTNAYDGDRFFIIDNEGIRRATPIFVCMVAVELSDVVFAVDSIPAVFGVTEVSASLLCCCLLCPFPATQHIFTEPICCIFLQHVCHFRSPQSLPSFE